MKAQATQKYIRMSPRKLRLVADAVRKMNPAEAIETLPFIRKRAALPVAKVIKTAVANAKVKGANEDTLEFESVQITEGPRLKRFRPVSRGRAHGYIRRMSHIKVVLKTREQSG